MPAQEYPDPARSKHWAALGASGPPSRPPAPGLDSPQLTTYGATTDSDTSSFSGGAVWRWPARNGLWGALGLFAVVSLLYALGSGVALQLIEWFALDGVFFIPAGITVAFLLRLPKGFWWIVLAAAGSAEYSMDVIGGLGPRQSVGFAIANVAEPVVGAAIVAATCGAIDLARRRHVVWFTIGAVVVGPAVGGVIVALTNQVFGDGEFWATFGQVWLGDSLGVVVVGSCILVWGSSPDQRSVLSYWGVGLLLGTAALTGLVLTLTGQPLAFAGLIGIALAGALFGLRAVALASLAVTLTLAVVLALDPGVIWFGLEQGETLVLVKLQVLIFSLAGLLIAAEAHERERALARASRSASEAELLELEREREHDVALRVQRSLLPDSLLQRSGVEIEAEYQSASATHEVGGDWYDSFELPDGRLGLVVGDIVGHGITAMTSMGRLRTALSALAMSSRTPSMLLRDLDLFVGGPDGTAYATVFYAIVDVEAATMDYASAGHPPGLVLRRSGTSEWLDAGLSGPLFGDSRVVRKQASAVIGPGDVLILYSDGLVERRGESLDEGLSRLEQVAQSLSGGDVRALCRGIVSELDPGGSREDDVVVLVFKLRESQASTYQAVFPARPDQLHEIRESVRSWLGDQNLSHVPVDDVILGLSEATSNVVRHAYTGTDPGDIEVRLTHDDNGLVVDVEDRGRWRAGDGGGRPGHGIRIMGEISDQFEIEETVLGTRVRFTFQA